MTHRSPLLALLLLLVSAPGLAQNPVVSIETPLGTFQVELFEDVAPNTVANFLAYVDSGRYVNSFVHRSSPDFVIQGGGFTFNGLQVLSVEVDDPIENEFSRSNVRGTISMAKNSGDPDSATSQWFINLADNNDPDSNDLDNQNGGFTVFGEVIGDGMKLVACHPKNRVVIDLTVHAPKPLASCRRLQDACGSGFGRQPPDFGLCKNQPGRGEAADSRCPGRSGLLP